jgi:hypothetical protein
VDAEKGMFVSVLLLVALRFVSSRLVELRCCDNQYHCDFD